MNNNMFDGWILQESSSIPGKFYYFNVNNGQSLWTIKDAEELSTNNAAKTDKNHYFPEPKSPPFPICFTTRLCCIHGKLKNATNETKISDTPFESTNPNPLFGKACFQTYLSNDKQNTYTTSKTDNVRPFKNPDLYSPNPVNKIFNSDKTTSNPTGAVYCSVLNKEKKENTLFNKDVTLIRDNTCDKRESGMKFKEPVLKETSNYIPKHDLTTLDKFFEDPNPFQTKCSLNSEPKVLNPFQSNKIVSMHNLYPKRKMATDIFKDTPKKPNPAPNMNSLVNNYADKATPADGQDLRKILNCRKRSNVEDSNSNDHFKGKIIRTNSPFKKPVTQKKYVTFNLDGQFNKDSSNDYEDQLDSLVKVNYQKVEENESKKAILQKLKALAKPMMSKDLWYIAVDTVVLLEDYDFIESFVQQDSQCRLLITLPVRSDIVAMSSGRSFGQQRVMIARKIARKFIDPPQHLFLQPTPETGGIPVNSSVDSIVYNCQQIMDQKYHVVLVSNSVGLLAKAKFNDIPCHKLHDLKYIITAVQERLE